MVLRNLDERNPISRCAASHEWHEGSLLGVLEVVLPIAPVWSSWYCSGSQGVRPGLVHASFEIVLAVALPSTLCSPTGASREKDAVFDGVELGCALCAP